MPDDTRPKGHEDHPLSRSGIPRETLIEKQIREAMQSGAFDNLPLQGKPLPNDDNPHAGEWGLAFKMLKDAGYAPPWIEADKEFRAVREKLDALVARAAVGPGPSAFERDRDHALIRHLVRDGNDAIRRLNAEAPGTRQHRRSLVLADELARYDEACRR
jgi:hypothetical protein